MTTTLKRERPLAKKMEIDASAVAGRISDFLRDRAAGAGCVGICLGISGGIDSAVVATLAVRAMEDPSKVHGLYLSDRDSGRRFRHRAQALAEKLGITFEMRDFTGMAAVRGVYRSPVVRAFRVSAGLNRMAMSIRKRFLSVRVAGIAPGRARQETSHATGPAVHAVLAPLVSSLNRLFAGFAARHTLRREILEEYAASHNLLLVGAANRTEAFTGWFVRGGVDDLPLEPILGLYKNQVVQLARYLGVPDEIVTAPPSPDMLKGVGDETLIGFSYDTLDRVAYVVEHGLDRQEAFKDGVSEEEFAGVCALHEKTAEKRTSLHEFPSFD